MRTIKDCKVCVVGGAGFIGSHLVRHLQSRNCDVMVVDNLVTGRKEFLPQDIQFEHHDITGSESHLYHLFRDGHVQYVFNYAAEPYIPVSFVRPLHVFNSNATGALQVLNAAEAAGCRGILQVSSAEIYGNQQGMISESAPVTPHSSYGASKAAIDFMVQVRWKESFLPAIAMRQFNCVGERETHPYIIPEIITQLSKHPDCVYLGNNTTRDFQYAGDAVAMAVRLLEMGQFGEVYNMGSQETIKIYELAQLIAHVMGLGSVEVIEDSARHRPWEIWHLQSDNTKLYSTIDCRPTVSLTDALSRTVDYYRNSNSDWGF